MEKLNSHDKIQWAAIEGYESYAISDIGVVVSLKRWVRGKGARIVNTKIMKPGIVRGYPQVKLYDLHGGYMQIYVHQLVANAFVENPYGYDSVHHKNFNRLDNRACNLEWMELIDNIKLRM